MDLHAVDTVLMGALYELVASVGFDCEGVRAVAHEEGLRSFHSNCSS